MFLLRKLEHKIFLDCNTMKTDDISSPCGKAKIIMVKLVFLTGISHYSIHLLPAIHRRVNED